MWTRRYDSSVGFDVVRSTFDGMFTCSTRIPIHRRSSTSLSKINCKTSNGMANDCLPMLRASNVSSGKASTENNPYLVNESNVSLCETYVRRTAVVETCLMSMLTIDRLSFVRHISLAISQLVHRRNGFSLVSIRARRTFGYLR
jgi:hypothetical protein